MTSFVLKIIALVTMFIDHIGYYIFGKTSYFNYIGRIAFPIFAFQISEGYIHTKNFEKYIFRIGFFAIISQLPFMLFYLSISANIWKLNIFFTLFLGLLAIFLYDKIKNKLLAILPVIIIAIFANIINVDYGAYGIALIFIFYLFKDTKWLMNLVYIALVTANYLPNIIKYNYNSTYIFLYISALIPLIFINLYNGKQGKNIKYLLYAFYPLHLLLIAILTLLFK